MVYGDHGRKLLHPLTTLNRVAVFPWAEFYSKLLHFRIFLRTGAVLAAGYGYFAFKQGTFDGLAFTPYLAVHHAISHKFAHDMEAQRYPVTKH